jgi:hypothetical protein
MRPVKSVIAAHFSTFPQRRIVARIDRMGEKILLRPGPELADVLIGLDDLVPQFQAVFCALGAAAPDAEGADRGVEGANLYDYFFFGGTTGNSR